jgi:hypothetical protein
VSYRQYKIGLVNRVPEVLSSKTCFMSFLAASSIQIFERRCILIFLDRDRFGVQKSNRLLPR